MTIARYKSLKPFLYKYNYLCILIKIFKLFNNYNNNKHYKTYIMYINDKKYSISCDIFY